MKKIIVPVDYSAATEQALTYAAGLAIKTDASLLLFSTYQLPVSTADMPVMLISVEEMAENTNLQLRSSRANLLQQYPQLKTELVSRLGDLVAELTDLCDKEPPFAVVVGHQHGSALDRLIEGNMALSIIKSVKRPVIIVPDTAVALTTHNIVLAVDLQETAAQHEKASAIADNLGGRLQLLYVQTGETGQAVPASFEVVKAVGFIEGIQAYVAVHQPDLILIFPHQHNLIERLFYTSHTEELVNKISVPVMCMREE